MRAMTWPTVTVSPSAARISVIVPAAGAGSSMSTLSVEISTIVSPSSTVSPTLTAHSRIVPSVTDSPPAGVTMSTISPARLGLGGLGARARLPFGCGGRSGAVLGGDLGEQLADLDGVALGDVELDDRAAGGRGDLGVDLVGRDLDEDLVGLDRVALLDLRHSRIVPSVTDSPIAGIVTWTVVFTAAMWTLDNTAESATFFAR